MTFDELTPVLDAYFATTFADPVALTAAYSAMVQLTYSVEVLGKDFRSEVIRKSQLPYYKERLTLNYRKRMELLK